jgi:DNA-binding CsgD family transcriptional regulator
MLPSGSVMLCHEQFDDKYVARSAFYQEYFIPIGLRWAMGATYHRADGTSVIVAGLRAPDLPHFSRRDARTLQLVMPHFCRALDLRTNLDAHLLAGSHVESILHALNQPALILDSDGKVLAANELAVGALQETLVRSRGGCLSFESSESHYAWREAISVAARTGTARALSIRLGATRCIRARLVPLKQLGVAADERERRMMLATFSREDGQTADVSSFVDEFGLSRAESEVLEQLLNGSVAKQIASHRNTSLNTVRMQIRTLLQKTGARSQRELLLRCSSPISRLCGRIRTDAQ